MKPVIPRGSNGQKKGTPLFLRQGEEENFRQWVPSNRLRYWTPRNRHMIKNMGVLIFLSIASTKQTTINEVAELAQFPTEVFEPKRMPRLLVLIDRWKQLADRSLPDFDRFVVEAVPRTLPECGCPEFHPALPESGCPKLHPAIHHCQTPSE